MVPCGGLPMRGDILRIRDRLGAIGWSASELSRRSGVSREVISGQLNGRQCRQSPATSGSAAPSDCFPRRPGSPTAAPPADVTDEHLSRLVACVVTGRCVPLADLSDATGVAITAVRASLQGLVDPGCTEIQTLQRAVNVMVNVA